MNTMCMLQHMTLNQSPDVATTIEMTECPCITAYLQQLRPTVYQL